MLSLVSFGLLDDEHTSPVVTHSQYFINRECRNIPLSSAWCTKTARRLIFFTRKVLPICKPLRLTVLFQQAQGQCQAQEDMKATQIVSARIANVAPIANAPKLYVDVKLQVY